MLNFLFLPSLFLLLLLLPHQPTQAQNFFYQSTNNLTFSATESSAIQRKCNIFQGKWVFDTSSPHYDASHCPFIDLEFNCDSRPDKLFQKYRWQPFNCNLPRYRCLISPLFFLIISNFFLSEICKYCIYRSMICFVVLEELMRKCVSVSLFGFT